MDFSHRREQSTSIMSQRVYCQSIVPGSATNTSSPDTSSSLSLESSDSMSSTSRRARLAPSQAVSSDNCGAGLTDLSPAPNVASQAANVCVADGTSTDAMREQLEIERLKMLGEFSRMDRAKLRRQLEAQSLDGFGGY